MHDERWTFRYHSFARILRLYRDRADGSIPLGRSRIVAPRQVTESGSVGHQRGTAGSSNLVCLLFVLGSNWIICFLVGATHEGDTAVEKVKGNMRGTVSNKADAQNPAITSLFQSWRYWRGVCDLRR